MTNPPATAIADPASREVDTTLPEFSWIPFFRELAARLLDDWQGRQREIILQLQEWERSGLPVHPYVKWMETYIDPFSIYAILVQEGRSVSSAELGEAYRAFFGVRAEYPAECPLIQRPLAQSMFIFTGNKPEDTVHHWVTLRTAADYFGGSGSDRSRLEAALDASIAVRHAGPTSLPRALSWVDPTHFLSSHSIGRFTPSPPALHKRRGFGRAYLDALREVEAHDARPFPELALEERLCRLPGLKRYRDKVRCWFVPETPDRFVSGSPMSLGRQALPAANPAGERGVIDRSHAADPSEGVRQGDIVIAQDADGDLRYGFVASTLTYSSDILAGGPGATNLRNVYWRPTKFTPEELGVDVSDDFIEVASVRSHVLPAIMRAEYH